LQSLPTQVSFDPANILPVRAKRGRRRAELKNRNFCLAQFRITHETGLVMIRSGLVSLLGNLQQLIQPCRSSAHEALFEGRH